jgi:hypothetical protein
MPPEVIVLLKLHIHRDKLDYESVNFCSRHLGIHNLGIHNLGIHNLGIHSLGIHNLGIHNLGIHSLGIHNLGSCHHSVLCSKLTK